MNEVFQSDIWFRISHVLATFWFGKLRGTVAPFLFQCLWVLFGLVNFYFFLPFKKKKKKNYIIDSVRNDTCRFLGLFFLKQGLSFVCVCACVCGKATYHASWHFFFSLLSEICKYTMAGDLMHKQTDKQKKGKETLKKKRKE